MTEAVVSPQFIQIGVGEIITLLVLGIGFTAWLIRLESKTLNNQRDLLQTNLDVKELRARHDTMAEKIAESMSYIREALAEIRGRLAIKEEKDH